MILNIGENANINLVHLIHINVCIYQCSTSKQLENQIFSSYSTLPPFSLASCAKLIDCHPNLINAIVIIKGLICHWIKNCNKAILCSILF